MKIHIAIPLIAIILIDLLWVGLISRRLYLWGIGQVQGSPAKLRPQYALLAYGVIALTIFYVVGPLMRFYLPSTANKFMVALKSAGLVAFVTYALYNLTSLAIYNNYPLPVALIDTCWATCSWTLVMTIFLWLSAK